MLGRRKTGARWGPLWANDLGTPPNHQHRQKSHTSLSINKVSLSRVQKAPPLVRLSALAEKKEPCSLSLLLRSIYPRPKPQRLPTARTNDTNRPSKRPAFLVRPSLQLTFRSPWSVNTAFRAPRARTDDPDDGSRNDTHAEARPTCHSTQPSQSSLGRLPRRPHPPILQLLQSSSARLL